VIGASGSLVRLTTEAVCPPATLRIARLRPGSDRSLARQQDEPALPTIALDRSSLLRSSDYLLGLLVSLPARQITCWDCSLVSSDRIKVLHTKEHGDKSLATAPGFPPISAAAVCLSAVQAQRRYT
jgi:hypothetical protein